MLVAFLLIGYCTVIIGKEPFSVFKYPFTFLTQEHNMGGFFHDNQFFVL